MKEPRVLREASCLFRPLDVLENREMHTGLLPSPLGVLCCPLGPRALIPISKTWELRLLGGPRIGAGVELGGM